MKILIAVDEEPESNDALTFAKRILPADAEVVVLNVVRSAVSPYGTLGTWGAGPYGDAGVPVIEDMQGAEQSAERTVNKASEGLDDAEERVEHGPVGPMICEVAETADVDLVVLGTHDRSRWGRLWFGSVSDHVMHHAPCPVLVVR